MAAWIKEENTSIYSPQCHMNASVNWIIISSGNGLHLFGAKPLPETIMNDVGVPYYIIYLLYLLGQLVSVSSYIVQFCYVSMIVYTIALRSHYVRLYGFGYVRWMSSRSKHNASKQTSFTNAICQTYLKNLGSLEMNKPHKVVITRLVNRQTSEYWPNIYDKTAVE